MIAAQFSPPQAYNGEHTSDPRNGTRLLQWRKAVKERDNYTCQICGATDKMTVAHHKQPFALFPELRYETSNGITLCYNCHYKLHSLQTTSE
jgi:5-methylcytosine-specific restriction endonuclease McrA